MNSDNQFLQFLLEKLSDLIYQMKESNGVRQNLYDSSLQKYSLFDDFFTFFQSLNISEQSLFEFLQEKKSSFSLAQILFGNELANDIHRKNKIEQFVPLLEKNFDFFQECFSTCLQTHKYISHALQNKNQEYFLTLIHIGLKNNYFSKIPEKEKETDFPNYKNILLDLNIFQQDYDIQKTIDILYSKNIYKKPAESDILKHFIMFYEPIYHFLSNITKEKWTTIIKENFPQSSNIEESSQKFMNELCFYLLQTPLQHESKYFMNIFDKPFIRHYLLEENKKQYNSIQGINALFVVSNLLNESLPLFSDYEKQEIFNFCDYSKTFLFQQFYTKPNPHKEKNDYFRTLETIISCLEKNITTKKAESSVDYLITTMLLNNLSANTSAKTIDYLFHKYQNHIFSSVDFQLAEEPFKLLIERIHFFIHKSPNLDFIKNHIQQKVILYFENILKTPQDKMYQAGYSIQNDMKKISHFMNSFSNNSFFNHFNNNWLDWGNFSLDYSQNNQKHRTTYIENHNIMFYLFVHLSANQKEYFMDWILKPENIDQFSHLIIKNKHILPYYEKENPKIYSMMLHKILNDSTAFSKIIGNNKKEIKKILLIDDDELQKKLQYQILNTKIINHRNEKKQVKI